MCIYIMSSNKEALIALIYIQLHNACYNVISSILLYFIPDKVRFRDYPESRVELSTSNSSCIAGWVL